MIYFYEIYYRTANEVHPVYCGDVATETEARDECFKLSIEFPQNYYFYESVVVPSFEL
jgi:hypothetical protein